MTFLIISICLNELVYVRRDMIQDIILSTLTKLKMFTNEPLDSPLIERMRSYLLNLNFL